MLQPSISTISSKWQIVIPKEARKKIKVASGDKVWVRVVDPKRLEVKIIGPDPLKTAFGMLADKSGRSWTKELVEERRKDAEKEEEKLKKFSS